MSWQTKKLAEVLQKTKTVNPLLAPNKKFLYVDVSGVSNKNFIIENFVKLKGKDAPSRARKLICAGDIIFATVRPTLQRIAVVPEELDGQVCSTGYFVLRANEKIISPLLFYFLQTPSFSEQMEKLQRGASYPAVTDGDVKKQLISFPESITEQKRIVKFLDTVFADIAKAKENTEKNLQNSRELFESYLQSIFENNGEDWEEHMLGDVLQKTETVDPTKKQNEKFIYIDVSSVNKETKEIENVTSLLGRDAPSRARKLIKTNDVIFATVRPTHGRVALVIEEYNNQVCSTGYFVLRAKEFLNNNLVFYFLLTCGFNKQMEKLQKGASYPAVTDSEVKGIFISYPKSLPEQKAIVKKLDALSGETKKLEEIYKKKLVGLEELKKSVLKRAFEGKL